MVQLQLWNMIILMATKQRENELCEAWFLI